MYTSMYNIIMVYDSVVTYPLDITRTRLQIQGEVINHGVSETASVTIRRGMLQTLSGIGMLGIMNRYMNIGVTTYHSG